jgi:hypothetical protein
MGHILKNFSKFNESWAYVEGLDGRTYTIADIKKIVKVVSITINDAKSVSVDSTVFIEKANCPNGRLPFRFESIAGSFICEGCELESLEGGPKYVDGDYNCSNNNLTKLTYDDVPNNIGGNLIIAKNPNLVKEGGIWEVLKEDIVDGQVIFYQYKFEEDFNSDGGALTLSPSEIRDDDDSRTGIELTKTHPDGWTITGIVSEDYFEWVSDFVASHPEYGKVWGNFESKVFADSEEGYNDFYKRHTPDAWDYGDI